MSLEQRFTAILSAPMPPAWPHAPRTSPAFAARFSAEAQRSGLSLDLADDRSESQVQLCPTCGAQNSRFVTACFNCQTELGVGSRESEVSKRRPPAESPRWSVIANSPRISTLPLRPRTLVHARFMPPPSVARVETTQVLSRFLTVFVEREEQAKPPPPSVQRFDQRSALDKFLSVFVEKNAPAEAQPPAEDSGTFEKVLGLFVERKK